MRELFKQISVGLISAIAGGIVSIIILANGWIWSGLFGKLKFEIANVVMKQLEFTPERSPMVMQDVTFSCPEGTQLVSASCIGNNGSPQAAVGPDFHRDGSFSCMRYGNVGMPVQATAICFKVRR